MRQNKLLLESVYQTFRNTEGFIVTFTLRGGFKDASGIERDLVNRYIPNEQHQSIASRIQKSVDRALTETRRTVRNRILFVPYEGGNRYDKTHYHLHGLIELPLKTDATRFQSLISTKFQIHLEKLFRTYRTIKGDVWFNKIDYEKLFGYSTRYCSRSEDNFESDNFNDNKILCHMKSFCLAWHQ